MSVDYRLSITEVLIDKQLSTLIKLSNESRCFKPKLMCHLPTGELWCIVKS